MINSRLALLFLVVFIAAPASAGEYAGAYERQKRCEVAGELAQSFYGRETKDLREKADEFDQQVKKKVISRQFAEETKFILFLGKTAKSPKDAYMSAWSWCMDQKK